MKPNHFKFYEATISGKIDLPYVLDEIFNREKTKPVLRFYHNNKLKYKWGLYESNGVIDHHIDNVVDAHKILLKHLDII
jgi:hypothetical protein